MLNFGHTFAHAIESSLDNNLSNKGEILRTASSRFGIVM